ncbi:MAG: type IVB pilus formation R64 PilN family outer membrane protein [Oleiphilaceae bacterium]|jgi:type IVB pilus formation R64 PilN family outer membrane protein
MKKIVIFLPLIAALLSGCLNHKDHIVTKSEAKETDDRIQTIKQAYYQPESTVQYLEFPPPKLVPIVKSGEPSWYGEKKNAFIEDMGFGVAIRTIFKGAPVSLGFDADVDQEVRISTAPPANGTLKNWLDTLSLASGYGYYVEGNHISWSRFSTVSIDISAFAGSTTHLLGTSLEDNQDDNDSSSTSSSSVDFSTNEFSNTTGELSIWNDLRSILTVLTSPEGSFDVSEASTTVTIRDFPENVRSIQRFIADFNDKLRAQALISVEIIVFEYNRDRSDGIDWNLVRAGTDTTLSLASPVTQFTSAAVGAPSTISLLSNSGSMSGSQLLIQALDQQGSASIITSPSVITLNNQVGEVRITEDQGFLASASISVDEGITQASLEPGVAVDGFTLYVLPKIDLVRDEIILQFSATLSDLQDLETVTSGGSSIQTPLIQRTKSNNRARLKNGETLIISGYKQASKDTKGSRTASGGALNFFGTQVSNNSKFEVLMLVTPVILD